MVSRKFKYSLDSLIKKGKLDYDQQFLMVESIKEVVDKLNRRLEQEYEKQVSIESELRKEAESRLGLLDPERITLRKNFLNEHKKLVETIRNETRKAEADYKREKSHLIELNVALKSLEKHKERTKSEFHAELERLEMREVDELWLLGKNGR